MGGQNMLPGHNCMDKIIIIWSDCENWGGGGASAPLAQPTLLSQIIYISLVVYISIHGATYLILNAGYAVM